MGLEYLNFRHSHGVHPNILSGNMILQTPNRQRKYRGFRRWTNSNGNINQQVASAETDRFRRTDSPTRQIDAKGIGR